MRVAAVICIALGIACGWWLGTQTDLGGIGWAMGILVGLIVFGAIRNGWESR